MIYSILIILTSFRISAQNNPSGAEVQFTKAYDLVFNNQEREALTKFLLVSGRYPKSPYSKWAIYFAASLYEKIGDFRAARVKYQQILKKHPSHPLIKNIIRKELWLRQGLKTGGPILLREWEKLFTEKKKNLKWASRCEEFLKRSGGLYWNYTLRTRLAAWYMLYQYNSKALKHLKIVAISKDSKSAAKSLKVLGPIYLNSGKTKELREILKNIEPSTVEIRELVKNQKIASLKVDIYRYYHWYITAVMVLFLMALIVPFKQKRSLLPIIGVPLGALFWLIPSNGPTLSIIIINVSLFFLLMGKRRPKYVWIPGILYLIYIPIHSLIITNNFPWTAVL